MNFLAIGWRTTVTTGGESDSIIGPDSDQSVICRAGLIVCAAV